MKHTLKINQVACGGCGLCHDGCPHDAIAVIAGQYVINPEKCQLCHHCANRCMATAVEVVRDGN